MKKLYTLPKFKRYNRTRSRKALRRLSRSRDYNPNKSQVYSNRNLELVIKPPVVAPKKLLILEDTEKCLAFISEIRNRKNFSNNGLDRFITVDFSLLEDFDYSTICIFLAVIGDLKSRRIFFRSNFPEHPKCREKFEDSGLLNVMFNEKGKRYNKSETSELMFVERGFKKLSRAENIKISETVKKVMYYLSGQSVHNKQLRKVLLEICGNSIEWGGTKNKQWLLGVKYEQEEVIFTVTDVGQGILKTLNRKFKDLLFMKDSVSILNDAFDKKYGSKSKMANRNKGLPAIKASYEEGAIIDLKVLTNNVILHFGKGESRQIDDKVQFKGTLYRWKLTKSSLKILSK